MWMEFVAVLFLLLVGVLAGVLFAVDVAVVPMLRSLPAGQFTVVHRLLDPGFDPLMPRLSKVALVAGMALVVFGGQLGPRILHGVAVACVVGVAVVSEVCNVRLNRAIDRWAVDDPPERWAETRSRWGAANRVRTALAVAGFLAAVTGTALS